MKPDSFELPALSEIAKRRAEEVSAMDLADKDGRHLNAQGHQQAISAIDFCAEAIQASIAAHIARQGAEPVALDHIACIDDGELRYMSGRKAPAHDCELYAMPDGKRAPKLYAAPQEAQAVDVIRRAAERLEKAQIFDHATALRALLAAPVAQPATAAIPLNADGRPEVAPTIAAMDAMASRAGIPPWSHLNGILERRAQPATEAGQGERTPVELVIDGYKGEESIRWYISELQRVRFLNQWLADAYCNQLRDIYKDDFRATCRSDKEADIRANNKLADVWREGNTGLERWWKEGRGKPEDLRFEVEHDALSQRLIAALPPASAQPEHVAQDNQPNGVMAAQDVETWTDEDVDNLCWSAFESGMAGGMSVDSFRWLANSLRLKRLPARAARTRGADGSGL